jgi:hypothetical protein
MRKGAVWVATVLRRRIKALQVVICALFLIGAVTGFGQMKGFLFLTSGTAVLVTVVLALNFRKVRGEGETREDSDFVLVILWWLLALVSFIEAVRL